MGLGWILAVIEDRDQLALRIDYLFEGEQAYLFIEHPAPLKRSTRELLAVGAVAEERRHRVSSQSILDVPAETRACPDFLLAVLSHLRFCTSIQILTSLS